MYQSQSGDNFIFAWVSWIIVPAVGEWVQACPGPGKAVRAPVGVYPDRIPRFSFQLLSSVLMHFARRRIFSTILSGLQMLTIEKWIFETKVHCRREKCVPRDWLSSGVGAAVGGSTRRFRRWPFRSAFRRRPSSGRGAWSSTCCARARQAR